MNRLEKVLYTAKAHTTGGRTGLPAPRRVKHPPFLQFRAPTVWTTLALTIRADGTSSFEVLGASKFPRHWIYDASGQLGHKSGLTDYANWTRVSFGRQTPWGGIEGAPPLPEEYWRTHDQFIALTAAATLAAACLTAHPARRRHRRPGGHVARSPPARSTWGRSRIRPSRRPSSMPASIMSSASSSVLAVG